MDYSKLIIVNINWKRKLNALNQGAKIAVPCQHKQSVLLH